MVAVRLAATVRCCCLWKTGKIVLFFTSRAFQLRFKHISPFFVRFNCISLWNDRNYSLPQISLFVICKWWKFFTEMLWFCHFISIYIWYNWTIDFSLWNFVAFRGNLLERLNRVCTDCVNQSISFNLMRHKRTLSYDAVIDYDWMQTTALQVSGLARSSKHIVLYNNSFAWHKVLYKYI